MDRAYNFNAGPSAMPLEVLKEAQAEFLDFQNTGMSVIEISHRSAEYSALHQETKALLRELMEIPEDYEVLFCQGGGSTQFLMVAANFFTKARAAYVNTGVWAGKALKEAQFFGEAYEAASSADKNHSYIPQEFTILPDTSYVHLTANNTIYGTEYQDFPHFDVPVVCDMSSDILSRRVNVADFDLIYAGAQKNLGPAGVTIAIVKKDFLATARTNLPTMLKYQTFADKDSLYNTPPVFAIYMVNKTLHWIQNQGGVDVIQARNAEKSGAHLRRDRRIWRLLHRPCGKTLPQQDEHHVQSADAGNGKRFHRPRQRIGLRWYQWPSLRRRLPRVGLQRCAAGSLPGAGGLYETVSKRS